eukprot:3048412-Rhodomonas_salina.3
MGTGGQCERHAGMDENKPPKACAVLRGGTRDQAVPPSITRAGGRSRGDRTNPGAENVDGARKAKSGGERVEPLPGPYSTEGMDKTGGTAESQDRQPYLAAASTVGHGDSRPVRGHPTDPEL